jgi:hypothetical protein
MQINKRPRITNLQHLRIKVRTFNIQKQKPSTSNSKQEPSTSKNKSKNLQYPIIKTKTSNIHK